MNTKRHNWMTFILSFLLITVFVVACDDNNQTGTPGAGGGLGSETATSVFDTDLTPVVTVDIDNDNDNSNDNGNDNEAITPVVTEMETPVVVQTDTPMMEETATVAIATPMATSTSVATGTMTETNVMLVTDLIGMNIVNDADEDVGEISELLVDRDGNIRYVIFDAGDFLGVDERVTAMTWDTFDASLPPVMNNITATNTITEERTITFRGMAADIEAATEVDMDLLDDEGFVLNADEVGLMDDASDGLLQLSEFTGVFDNDFNLINLDEEDLGEVEDAIIDLHEGRLLYAVVDFGGFLGLGENTVAVPWQRLDFNEENEQFILDIADISLEDAPTLDLDLITDDDMRDPDWDLDIRNYWETTF